MNPQTIVNNVLKGSPKDERELYKFFYVRLFKVARAYCADKEEATGVFNFAMVDIFKNLKPFDDEGHLIRWARRILVNDCIDHVRKKTVYRNKLMVVAEKAPSVTQNEGLDNLSMEEIFAKIDMLDTNTRVCFVMKVLEGYTHKEIAEKLDINVNTSKWYVAEAKKKLRVVLLQSNIV